MGKITGFIEFSRNTHGYKKVEERVTHFEEFVEPLSTEDLEAQGARCMDCGIPFCHSRNGCPLGNIIPDFNHFVYQKDYKNAFLSLKKTNNFPDITGRICPAPCESACVLGINQPPVSIKNLEYSIAEAGVKNGWQVARKPKYLSGKKVVVIGSGPSGLACADQLNVAGHSVTVLERDDKLGGLLTYGIPNFKLDKSVIFQHIERMDKEGVVFRTKVEVGKDVQLDELQKNYDAVILAIGSTVPRDLTIENRETKGIHFAMEYLKNTTQKILGGDELQEKFDIKGKDVLVIGGGDTGSDCIGTSNRLGCKSVTQIEITPQPPNNRDETMPWPQYDRIFRVSTSQEEGCKRIFSILTKKFVVESGVLKGIEYSEIEWSDDKKSFKEIGKPRLLVADVIFLAMGFLGIDPVINQGKQLRIDQLGRVECHDAMRIKSGNSYRCLSSDGNNTRNEQDNLFVAGDARRGQSLVVWAISEGRECAREVDEFLSGQRSSLPAKDESFYLSPSKSNSKQ